MTPSRRAVLGGLLAAPAAVAAPVAPAPRPDPAEAALVARSGVTGAVGYVAIRLDDGAVLAAREAERAFPPASVAKAPTGLFALDVLGPQARMATDATALGPVRDGVVEGDVALVGGYDPRLDSAGLLELAHAVAAAGVRRVRGRVRARPGLLTAAIDPGQREDASYNPAVAALNLNFNRLRVAWSRRAGEAWLEAHGAGWSPRVAHVGLSVAPRDCGCAPLARAGDGGWRIRADQLRGEGGRWLPVRDPGAYAGVVFAAALAEAGVTVEGAPDLPAGAATPLGATLSPPLAEMARAMLRWSNNLTAEVLGVAAAGAPAIRAAQPLEAGAAVLNAWCGGGFALRNFSGLSAASRATPADTAAFLAREAGGRDRLAPLLPTVSVDDRRGRAPAGATVAAKTGTLNYVRGLAGYAVAPAGRRIAFAYYAADLQRRATFGAAGARAWRNRAVTLERALIRGWLDTLDG